MINVKYSTLLLISGERGGIWNEIRLIWQLDQCPSGLYICVSHFCLWLRHTHTQMNIAPSCLCLCRIFLARPTLLWERWLDRWAVARRNLSCECLCAYGRLHVNYYWLFGKCWRMVVGSRHLSELSGMFSLQGMKQDKLVYICALIFFSYNCICLHSKLFTLINECSKGAHQWLFGQPKRENCFHLSTM